MTIVWRSIVPMVIALCAINLVRAAAFDAPDTDASNPPDTTHASSVPDTAKASTDGTLETLTVGTRAPPRDEKSYRNLIKAMTVFDQNRQIAPQAVMRFRVLPWHDESEHAGG